MIYSHSRITCYDRCPRAFRYKYIDKIQVEDFETVERFMGSAVHKTLEGLYKDLISGHDVEEDKLLDRYMRLWDENEAKNIVVNCEKSALEDYIIRGRNCITGYIRMNQPIDVANTLAVEMRINLDIRNDGNYRLTGFIDRVENPAPGVYEIHDYKTSKNMISQRTADQDTQLAIYEMGLRQKIGDIKDVRYVWHYLSHNKRIQSKRTPDMLEEAKADIISSIHQIEESIVEDWFPTVKTPRCRWCEYHSICANRMHTANTKQQRLTQYH